MKPQFTSAQLARQDRWRREEQFSKASTIINGLMPILQFLLPGFIHVAAFIMSVVDIGLTANRKRILHDEQKALNATKKAMLVKKADILNQLSKFEVTTDSLLNKPTNIKVASSYTGGSITKRRPIDTTLIKPTNILANLMKKDNEHAPSKIDKHKR